MSNIEVLPMRYRALSLRGTVKASALFASIIAVIHVGFLHDQVVLTIDLDLGTPPHVTSKVTSSFDAMNGTTLQGQTLSLDFRFSNGEFVRLFTITSPPFLAVIHLQTNSSGMFDCLSGDCPSGTGFLVDQHGNALQPPQELGSAGGNNGLLAAGLQPLMPVDLSRPLDFFGIHFDLTLPVRLSVAITGEEFLFESPDKTPFGVGPGVPSDIVPDSGSTCLLLCLGVIGLLGGVRKLDSFSNVRRSRATLARSR